MVLCVCIYRIPRSFWVTSALLFSLGLCVFLEKKVHFFLRRKVHTLDIIFVMFLTSSLRTFKMLFSDFIPLFIIEFSDLIRSSSSFRILDLFLVIVAGLIGMSLPGLFTISLS